MVRVLDYVVRVRDKTGKKITLLHSYNNVIICHNSYLSIFSNNVKKKKKKKQDHSEARAMSLVHLN